MREVAVAEEQPVAPAGAAWLALLHEAAERRDAGAGADHDDVGRRVGQAEVLVRLDGPCTRAPGLQAVGNEGRGDAGAGAAVALVAHGRDQEMRLVADLGLRDEAIE